MEQNIEIKKIAKRAWLIMLIAGIVLGIGGIVMVAMPFILPKESLPDLTFPKLPSSATDVSAVYSDLTGAQLADASQKTAPAFCVQTPNGLDGARPQAGLNEAGVIFEAIAEAGITRFAAIYQNPDSAVIGPLRSLRIYYLQWDTPFDCTIVHAGGSGDALAAVSAGGYKDLTENYAYMYRGAYPNYDRLWNNLFTTSSYLKQMASDYGYTTSNINGFARLTPAESNKARIDAGVAEKLNIVEPATKDVANIVPSVTGMNLMFGGYASYNVSYAYNAATNTYDRSYASGEPHWVYSCPAGDLGEVTPESSCTLVQMSPAVVAVMMVDEHIAADNYHEDIATIGTGSAYVFQNGTVIAGTWTKNSTEDQIVFRDSTGSVIALAPGQTIIEALPTYGGLEY